MSNEHEIPPRFFQTMKFEELHALLWERDGWLNAEECRRLWRMCDYQGEPPQTLQLLLNKADLLRMFPPKQKRSKR
jgi:hypothetical protein